MVDHSILFHKVSEDIYEYLRKGKALLEVYHLK